MTAPMDAIDRRIDLLVEDEWLKLEAEIRMNLVAFGRCGVVVDQDGKMRMATQVELDAAEETKP